MFSSNKKSTRVIKIFSSTFQRRNFFNLHCQLEFFSSAPYLGPTDWRNAGFPRRRETNCKKSDSQKKPQTFWRKPGPQEEEQYRIEIIIIKKARSNIFGGWRTRYFWVRPHLAFCTASSDIFRTLWMLDLSEHKWPNKVPKTRSKKIDFLFSRHLSSSFDRHLTCPKAGMRRFWQLHFDNAGHHAQQHGRLPQRQKWRPFTKERGRRRSRQRPRSKDG